MSLQYLLSAYNKNEKKKNIQKKSKKNDDERETKQEARKDINLKNDERRKKNQ